MLPNLIQGERLLRAFLFGLFLSEPKYLSRSRQKDSSMFSPAVLPGTAQSTSVTLRSTSKLSSALDQSTGCNESCLQYYWVKPHHETHKRLYYKSNKISKNLTYWYKNVLVVNKVQMTLPFIILTKTFNYRSIKLKPWLKDEYKCSITFMMHMFTWHASFGLCGCLETGGNSVKYWLSWLCILFRIVLAPYSSLGEASQHGTKLWASTWNT